MKSSIALRLMLVVQWGSVLTVDWLAGDTVVCDVVSIRIADNIASVVFLIASIGVFINPARFALAYLVSIVVGLVLMILPGMNEIGVLANGLYMLFYCLGGSVATLSVAMRMRVKHGQASIDATPPPSK